MLVSSRFYFLLISLWSLTIIIGRSNQFGPNVRGAASKEKADEEKGDEENGDEGSTGLKELDVPVCIVGAGLSGAVIAERYATELKQRVLVIEKRDHIGGNVYDYIDEETGIRVSKYGAHLFHTNYKRVWDYVQGFVDWIPYEHEVLAYIKGKHVPVPVNIDTVNRLFDLKIKTKAEMDEWLSEEQVHYEDPKNSEEMALSRVGQRLYDLLFKPYTIKQWDKTPAELGPEVLARIPVRNDHDARYFPNDVYQALPAEGYTDLFERMFDHELIEVRTNRDYFDIRSSLECKKTYFTGQIDLYYAHMGWPKLEYRSLNFERKVVRNIDFFQPKSVVNHPGADVDYTRIVEYKHLPTAGDSPDTVLFYERSNDDGEPYYPVPDQKNKDLYARYQELAENDEEITFVGRLANYKYFNMDQTIKNALEVFDKDVPCRPGKFQDAAQWRSLFKHGLSLKGKALVSIAIGKKGRKSMDALIESMGHTWFDYLLFAFDDTDWETSTWFDKDGVTVKRTKGKKWTLYYDYLTPDVVEPYTHLFLWDDDMSPAPGFDAEVILQIVQSLNIEISQPMIRTNSHKQWEGTGLYDRGEEPLRTVKIVEVMVPIYSKRVWLDCALPHLIRDHGSGWGIDTVLMNYGDCVPDDSYSLRLPMDHNDLKTLPWEELRVEPKDGEKKYEDAAKARGEKPRAGFEGPYKELDIEVDDKCNLRTIDSPKESFSKFLSQFLLRMTWFSRRLGSVEKSMENQGSKW